MAKELDGLFGPNAGLINLKYQLIDGSVSCGVVGNNIVISGSTTTKYIQYSCVYGDKFRVRALGGNGPRRWAFVTLEGKIISISDNPGTVVDEIITAPPFTAFLIVNNLNTNPNFNLAKLLDDNRVDNILKSTGLVIYDITNTVEKQWSNTSGSIVENVSSGGSIHTSRGIELNVVAGEVFQIFTFGSSTRKPYYVCNSGGEILTESATFGDNTLIPLKIQIPTGGTKLFINLVNSLGSNDSTITSRFMVVKYTSETDTRFENVPDVIGTEYAGDLKNYSLYQNNNSTIDPVANRIYDASLSSLRLACQEGDIFVIKGVGGFSGRLYAFSSAGGTMFTTEPTHKAIANANTTTNGAVVVAPASSAFIYINCRMDSFKSIVKVSREFNNMIINGGSSLFADITETAESAVDIANEAKSIAQAADQTINNITYNNGSGYDWFYSNATKRADNMLARQILTAKANKMITTNLINLKTVANANGGSVVFQHDASNQYHMTLSKLYTVCIANDVNNEDSSYSTHVYVVLYVLDGSSTGVITTGGYQRFKVAGNGDVISGITITSGAGVPNSYLIGDTLHIIFSAQGSDSKWYLFKNTFNCITGTLGTPTVCQMGGVNMTCEKIASYDGLTTNGMISINASIAFLSGYYYACCCSVGSFTNGLILRTTDFLTWEFVKKPIFTGFTSQAMFEGAMGAIGGNLFLALRQNDWDSGVNVNPVILAKMDAAGNVLDNVLIPSMTSRPAFFMRGTTELHLALSADNRTSSMVMLINSTNLRDSIVMQDISTYGNYTSVCPRSANLQFVCYTTGTTGVNVSSMNYGQKTYSDVMTAIMDAIVI